METADQKEDFMKFVHLIKSVRNPKELQEARDLAEQHGFSLKEENVALTSSVE